LNTLSILSAGAERLLNSNRMNRILILLFSFLTIGQLAAQHDGDTKNKKAKASFDLAYTAYTRGEFEKALTLCDKAIKRDMYYFDAYELKATVYESSKREVKAMEMYKKVISLDPQYRQVYYYLAELEFNNTLYADAVAHLEKFLAFPGDFKRLREKAEKLLASAKFAADAINQTQISGIRNMGPAVNSKLNEYWPGMTIDGKTLVFTRLVDRQEDFYFSELKDTTWQKAEALKGNINTPDNEGTVSIPADGSLVFHTYCGPGNIGSCDIVVSQLRNGLWSQRRNLGPGPNSEHWESGPAVSADGNSIIFASNRPGGKGGRDLWMSSRMADGTWTPAMNLGVPINTSGDEEAPFLHYDGQTLYFASTGHPGLGNHDLFMSRLGSDGKWSQPVNLGSPVNTAGDEMGLYVDRLGNLAYFASNRPEGYGGLDLYSFALPPSAKPVQTTYVAGRVIDAETGSEVAGDIEITELATSHRVFASKATRFITPLRVSGNYGLAVKAQGYVFYSENFQPDSGTVDQPFEVVARLKKYKAGEVAVLRNTFFDTDKTELKPESMLELDRVVEMLQQNPTMRIEISGHTDNTGKPDYNQKLSLGRAESVKAYLGSKGIVATRIEAKGYGDTRPVADNATPEGRAQNRRTEMKIISI